MAPKKGLSMEQKREKMVELFHETQEVFQMKELEKLGPRKGVIVQSIKEVVESLANDELINRDKIGGSWFYWSFPSEKANKVKQLAQQTANQVTQLRAKRDALKATLEMMSGGEVESEAEIKKLQEELHTFKKIDSQLTVMIAGYKDCDPSVISKYEEDYEVACEAADRWTCNVVSLRRWITEKSNMEEREFNKQFGIKDDFEDLEF